jgi:hypothetical protein
VKVDPLAPQVLIDYDLFCRRNGPYPFGVFVARWYAVTALIEAAEEEGQDPFDLDISDIEDTLPATIIN